MKKIIAMILSLAMVLALAVSASAATITINGGANGSEYSAWKLLSTEDLGESKYDVSVNETYRNILQKIVFDNKTEDDEWDEEIDVTDAEIIAYISGLTGDAVRTFADAVYAEVKDMEADHTTTSDKFENVDQGYYLIAETALPEGNKEDTYSLVMLNVVGEGETPVTTKENTPTLEKKVQEKDDSTGDVSDWQDGADYDIGDDVPYKLTGTVSDKYDSYKTYYYAFHDKLSTGLTFDADSVVVKIDGEVVSSGYRVVTPDEGKTALDDGCSFEVIFDNLKDLTHEVNGETKPLVNADSKIEVYFTAELNSGAVIGTPGNPNEAHLEYSNNPYDEGDGENGPETGETPEDKVIVFTYKLIANKVDEEGAALEGAGFTLYKYIAPVAPATEGTWEAVGEEITGETTFTFTGLDAGEYKLVETTVPAGYNKAEDIYFTIEAEYDTEADDPALKTLEVKDKDGNVISTSDGATGNAGAFVTDVADGSIDTDVENRSGVELPSTGGIGTTLFYVIGGVLMVGAVVLLVTKKRMNENQ